MLSRSQMVSQLSDMLIVESLFDRLPDVVFSVKDTEGRYLSVSNGCLPRCRLRNKRDGVGRTARELFPSHMAERYCRQDVEVFKAGKAVIDSLDQTVFNDGSAGWCLSNKHAVRNSRGELLGLVCISKDLTELSREGLIDARFASTVDFIHANYSRHLCLQELAEQANLSIAQLDRRMKRVFQLSTAEFVRRTRLEAALQAIADSRRSLADIAAATGFSDQSALHRLCRRATGLSPLQFRRQQGGQNAP
ncbi:helix-turn-helix domain-containing protein [Chitinimonas sp.]|uniref:AraC family transcriptional regulator n=1 Tax=Chitinimonas sp. TaxID=1934313 RepID=UPI0035B1A0D1